MALNPLQIDAITRNVLAKADASIANRVEARKGDEEDINAIRKALAKSFSVKAKA